MNIFISVRAVLSHLLWPFSLLSSAHGSKVTRILLREEGKAWDRG